MSLGQVQHINSLQDWLVSYMDTPALEYGDEPDVGTLYELLNLVEQSTRFKVIYTTRGADDWTALHFAVRWGHNDVVHTVLTSLSSEDRIRILWVAPAMHKVNLKIVILLAAIHTCIIFCKSRYRLFINICISYIFLHMLYDVITYDLFLEIDSMHEYEIGVIITVYPLITAAVVGVQGMFSDYEYVDVWIFNALVLPLMALLTELTTYDINAFVLPIARSCLLAACLLAMLFVMLVTTLLGSIKWCLDTSSELCVAKRQLGIRRGDYLEEPIPITRLILEEQSSDIISIKLRFPCNDLALMNFATKTRHDNVLRHIFDVLEPQEHQALLDYPQIHLGLSQIFGSYHGKVVKRHAILVTYYDYYKLTNEHKTDINLSPSYFDSQDLEEQQQGFLFYNSRDRDGAGQEAVKLDESLTHIGFTSTIVEWELARHLPGVIHEKISHLPDNTSVVIVCIMSHGKIGTLSDHEGTQLPLNVILHQLTETLSRDITLVVIIQACQDFSSMPVLVDGNTDMARWVAPPTTEDKHIVLRRPNTVLLMATIAGGLAVRGAYTGALAKQLRRANGKIEIRQMHTNAAREVQRLGYQQIPELRDTLTKSLMLPGRRRQP